MKLVHKWVNDKGEVLSNNDYIQFINQSKNKDIPLEEFLEDKGYKRAYSYGPLQSPTSNSAKLTKWFKDGLFISKWYYDSVVKDAARDEGLSIEEYLRGKGFSLFSDYNKKLPYNSQFTNWIHSSGRILARREYMKLLHSSRALGVEVKDYLYQLGYRGLLDTKDTEWILSGEFEDESENENQLEVISKNSKNLETLSYVPNEQAVEERVVERVKLDNLLSLEKLAVEEMEMNVQFRYKKEPKHNYNKDTKNSSKETYNKLLAITNDSQLSKLVVELMDNKKKRDVLITLSKNIE